MGSCCSKKAQQHNYGSGHRGGGRALGGTVSSEYKCLILEGISGLVGMEHELLKVEITPHSQYILRYIFESLEFVGFVLHAEEIAGMLPMRAESNQFYHIPVSYLAYWLWLC